MSRSLLPEITPLLVDNEWYTGDIRTPLARLRSEAPVAWDEANRYWVLSRHADVLRVSKDPDTFCSRRGVLFNALGKPVPEVPGSLLTADPPLHTHYRRILLPAFTPSRMRALEGLLRSWADHLVDGIEADTVVDVVRDLAVPFPLIVLAELMGLDANEWPRYHRWVDAAVEGSGYKERPAHLQAALDEMYAFLRGEVADAKGRPVHDGVISMLAHHRSDDGGELTDAEHMLFLAQLFIAGNETTRNLISGGMIALAEHPEQLARLVADPSLVPSAVEEMLRWTTPVWLFFRTATRDVVIGDQQIGEGEAVLMSYPAANFDRDEFGPTADDFDIARHPNHHLSFGFGTHFCLGAALARLEAKVLFDAVLGRFSSVTLAGPYRQAASHLLAGILEAPVRLGR